MTIFINFNRMDILQKNDDYRMHVHSNVVPLTRVNGKKYEAHARNKVHMVLTKSEHSTEEK